MRKLLIGIALLGDALLAPFSAVADDHQIKVDLLENGINPGFTSIPEIDDVQFIKSVAQFQEVNGLPVTGRLDERTLAKLNLTAVTSSKPQLVELRESRLQSQD